jgi:hypothetical protein
VVIFNHNLPSLADGKFFSPVAVRDNVTIPDQRAMIHFTNGVERLVIETRFSGSGTNFAWVIPLPAQPTIESATTGLFPTLEYLFRSPIRHVVNRYFVGILVGTGLICLFAYAGRSGTLLLATFCLLLLIAGMMLPSLAKAKGSASTTSANTVKVLDRQLVGVFETTTVSSRDPTALATWLQENSFRLPPNSAPVIAEYVRDGWVFVAAKVHRDQADTQIATAHPLSFTFPTTTPVYPLRLTGVDNGPLRVELYVFAPWRVEASHLRVERCTQPGYPTPPELMPYGMSWLSWTPETPNIVHPTLRQWLAGAPVATKLTATLTPDQMREDVWLRESGFREKRNLLYSRTGAMTVALNWGSSLFAIGLFVSCAMFYIRYGRLLKFGRIVGWCAVAGLGLAALVYLALPTAEVRLVNSPSFEAKNALYYLATAILDDRPRTAEQIRQELQQVLMNPGEDYLGVRLVTRHGGTGWSNLLLGDGIQEEDSPGNFTLRENHDALEFLGYDSQGAPHLLHSYPLQSETRREPIHDPDQTL